jgi:predicted amidohydrolase
VNPYRIALANLRFPDTPEESVALAIDAVEQAAAAGARILCFPECYVPGYRRRDRPVPPPDAAFLERAWDRIGEAAARAKVTVVLATERVTNDGLLATVLVINADGTRAGFQDKVQIDPSEEGTYGRGSGRVLFEAGALRFGVAICHEGWRYPETVRWAARRGAQLVFHPHYHWAEPGSFRPTAYGDPANSFHEKAVLCRAAENSCYFATVNYASEGSPTTSAIATPDGELLAWQPYGVEGLLVADIDLDLATGLLASRYAPVD